MPTCPLSGDDFDSIYIVAALPILYGLSCENFVVSIPCSFKFSVLESCGTLSTTSFNSFTLSIIACNESVPFFLIRSNVVTVPVPSLDITVLYFSSNWSHMSLKSSSALCIFLSAFFNVRSLSSLLSSISFACSSANKSRYVCCIFWLSFWNCSFNFNIFSFSSFCRSTLSFALDKSEILNPAL